MSSRIEQRKQAYEFIRQKAKGFEAKGSYKIEKYIEETDIVYLEDLDKLRRGIADPSNELVSILKNLFRSVASEIETEENLVKPFETSH